MNDDILVSCNCRFCNQANYQHYSASGLEKKIDEVAVEEEIKTLHKSTKHLNTLSSGLTDKKVKN